MLTTSLLVLSVLAVPQEPQAPLELKPLRGLPKEVPLPAGTKFDAGIAALGRALFFDDILSVDHKTTCASCHQPGHGFASVEALPPGSLGRRAKRNAPTLYNRAYGKAFSWDGKAETLEKQVILPISNPVEMALPLKDALQRLRASGRYGKWFRNVFAREATRDDLAVALASYVRTLFHGDTPVDRFRAGMANDLTPAERAGLWIFESKGRCWQCHSGPNASDESFHNTGVGVKAGRPRPGRFAVTGDPQDEGKFKTPTLRALTETAPYMHDGSMQTLKEVVEFYRRGGIANPKRDPLLRPIPLTDREAVHLVAFLGALSRRPKGAESSKQGTPRVRTPAPRRK